MEAAANAVIASNAQAARQALLMQQLEKCREENNPYKQGFFPGMAPRQAMWAPDPCQHIVDQLDELAGQTVENQPAQAAGSRSNAPSAQDLAAAPAPQLSETFTDPVGNTDPAIPESEFQVPSPELNNMWSPQEIEDTMVQIAEQIEKEEAMHVDQEIEKLLELMRQKMMLARMWVACWGSGEKWPLKLKYKPKNQAWVGKLLP